MYNPTESGRFQVFYFGLGKLFLGEPKWKIHEKYYVMERNILWDITTPDYSLEGDIEGCHYLLQLLASSQLKQLLWEMAA